LIEVKSNPVASAPVPALPDVRIPKARPLSVFVLYSAPLGDSELDYLITIKDIDQHHRSIFGSAASVTIGVDIAHLSNPRLKGVFASAERLICFAGKPKGLDAAVQDFCRRYNDADHCLITAYPKSDATYHPAGLRAMLMALDLHPSAHCAIVDPDLKNVVVDPLPSDVEGVLNYEERRKSGYTIFDTVIRRAGPLHDVPNGSVEFLSAFSTWVRRLRFPGAA
jgi:hypothetical protein